MERFGNDKPDLRFGMELVDIGPDVAGSEFRVFATTVAAGGRVKAIAAPASFTRREIDELEAFVRELGAAGLAWLAFEDGGVRGSVARFLSEAEIAAVRARTGAEDGTTAFIVAGDDALVARCLGRLRNELGRRLDLAAPDVVAFCWIVEPPLFEWDDDAERWDSIHHPFTAPLAADLDRLASEPGAVRARAYDIVANGYEIGGGSIRIHDSEIQAQVFELLGLSGEEIEAQFGHLIDAFRYGAPPHGGIAWGFDRAVAILAGEANIREVIAFPKALSGYDLVLGAPSPVPPENLGLLGIRLAVSPPPAAPSEPQDESER
jgi:aspartyl-tRNA synthetase